MGWRGGWLGEVCVSAVCVGDVGAHASFFFPGIMIQGLGRRVLITYMNNV